MLKGEHNGDYPHPKEGDSLIGRSKEPTPKK
jgi:hypothetical protein